MERDDGGGDGNGLGRRAAAVILVVLVVVAGITAGAVLATRRGERRAAAPAVTIREVHPSPTSSRPPTFPPEAVYPGFQPSGVAFWNARLGLIVGALAPGVAYAPCPACKGLIAATRDGGRHWRIVKATNGVVATGVSAGPGVSVAPGGQAWVALQVHEIAVGLLHTADWGRTWSETRTRLSSPSFVSPLEGWAIPESQPPAGTPPYIEHTIDGGATWSSEPIPCPSGDDQVVAANFAAPLDGWVVCVGQPGAGNQPKAILRTTDGGAAWRVVAGVFWHHPARGGLSWGGYPNGIEFAGKHGWLYGDRMSVDRTADGGRAWTPTAFGRDVDGVLSVSFVDPRLGFALAWGGLAGAAVLDRTVDGGRTWHRVRSWSIWGA